MDPDTHSAQYRQWLKASVSKSVQEDKRKEEVYHTSGILSGYSADAAYG